ncbi:Uma2 family endonuclease [Geodermatophilus sp. DF01-2]|uniref:Uma2 family endonuclease n=1 Tax=Geodermatophilus sp. DF01-2 TaxID=2559610 RepID=UPI001ADD829B|nr:Uma2 family endonuclease [Geodermatophilus sp. DF01_2]
MSAQPVSAVALMTAEQLMDLPDDGRRRELVDGELKEMAPAGFHHGQVALTIGALLRDHVRRDRLGVAVAAETGFRLSRDPDTVRAPDVAFVAEHRLPPRSERQRFLDLAPDLAVEVVSPSDRAADVTEKALAWLAAGTSLVWVVYPVQRVVAVHAADGTVAHVRADGEIEGGEVLPGLRLPVADLFE